MNLLLRQICKYKQKLSNFKWGFKELSIYYIENHYLKQGTTVYSTWKERKQYLGKEDFTLNFNLFISIFDSYTNMLSLQLFPLIILMIQNSLR